MKISFILVYSSVKNMILMDPKSWSSKDRYYNNTILEFTIKILKQIDSLDINKEIINRTTKCSFFSSPDLIHFSCGPIAMKIKNGIRNGIISLW